MKRYPIFLACTFSVLSSLALLLTNFPTWSWPGGDGRDYANITEALVEGGSLDLRNSSRPTRRADDYTVIESQDGSLYSIFPMGKALAQAPLLAVSRLTFGHSRNASERMLADNLSFSMTSALLFGLSGVLLLHLLSRVLEFSNGYSLLGLIFYCFGTIAFSFSKIHGVENLQAVLFMGMVISGLRPSRWSISTICFCFGWLVVTKPPSAVALPIFIYLFFHGNLWRRSHWPARVMAFLFASGFAVLFFYYNWLRSGDVGAAYGVGRVADVGFTVWKIPQTLMPLLFGPERNLFLNNPVLVLSLPGLFLMKNHAYLITALGLWLTMLLLYGASGNTNWGAYVGNARYTMPFIFLLIPPALAFVRWCYSQFSSRAAAWAANVIFVCLFLASLYVQFLYASFSEFHVKQFERTYNRYAGQYEMPRIDEAKHQLKFTHTLVWSTQSCQHTNALEQFDYPSRDPKTASFSAQVLKTFQPIWFCKDFLFMNYQWFPAVSWLGHLRSVLITVLLASLSLLIWLAVTSQKNTKAQSFAREHSY